MTDTSKILLLTRPFSRSQEFLSICEARAGYRLSAIISPIMKIEPSDSLPDLDAFRTVFVTSRAAVESAGLSLGGKDVITVGEKTARAAGAAGANILFTARDVEHLLNDYPDFDEPAIHLRGEHAYGDLAANLLKNGRAVEEHVIYRQPETPLSPEVFAALQSGARVVAPLFSARSARLLGAQISPNSRMSIIAISDAVASAWQDQDVVVASDPTADAMCSAVLEALSK